MKLFNKEDLEDIDLNRFMIRMNSKSNTVTSKMSLEAYCHRLLSRIEKLENTMQKICPHNNVKYINMNIYSGMLMTPSHIQTKCLDCNKVIDRVFPKTKGFSIAKKKYDEQEKKLSEAKDTIKKLE